MILSCCRATLVSSLVPRLAQSHFSRFLLFLHRLYLLAPKETNTVWTNRKRPRSSSSTGSRPASRRTGAAPRPLPSPSPSTLRFFSSSSAFSFRHSVSSYYPFISLRLSTLFLLLHIRYSRFAIYREALEKEKKGLAAAVAVAEADKKRALDDLARYPALAPPPPPPLHPSRFFPLLFLGGGSSVLRSFSYTDIRSPFTTSLSPMLLTAC